MHTTIKRAGVVGAVMLASVFMVPNISAAQTMEATTSDMMGGTTTVMVMKHLCNASIKNTADFQALETGRGPVAALANTVLNCPTTGLVGDEAVLGSVASPREAFGFTITGSGIPSQTLADATFMQHKVCESDISIDVNSDSTTSPATCLDISHYGFVLPPTMNGEYVVTETMAPANRHFGTMRFTPTELAMNNDSASLQSIDAATGKIYLRTNGDTDKMVMLHIYNFLNETTGGNGTTTGDDVDDEDTDDGMGMGHDNESCHGHDMYGNMVWMTAGDDHGHDMNGNDVQMDHCPSDHMDDMDNSKIEKIQRLQERMMKIQAQIIKLLEELLAER